MNPDQTVYMGPYCLEPDQDLQTRRDFVVII